MIYLLSSLLLCLPAMMDADPMNGGGRTNKHYSIANSDSFDTSYSDGTEYFDVYSKPIKTLYSEVHWRGHGKISLPDEIIERFSNDKIMAVRGYEVDQIMDDGTPVPITWAYNHHYCAFLMNAERVRMVERNATREAIRLGLTHGAATHVAPEVLEEEVVSDDGREIPQVQFFSEGNGGEMRMSYHGYPKGYAQIIQSPDTFHITPMQIDTWNREMKDSAYIPGPLPRSSRIPASAGYNGLLECPCSDRIPKEWHMSYSIDPGSCVGAVQNATECFDAAKQMVPSDTYNTRIIANASFPKCSTVLHEDGSADLLWNSLSNSMDSDRLLQSQTSTRLVGTALGVANLTLSLDGTTAFIRMTGPVEEWFGIGFGSNTMCLHMDGDECPTGGPYMILVNGETISERKLDYHGPGVELTDSLIVLENKFENGMRVVELTRSIEGLSKHHFTFDPSQTTVPIIMATGCGRKFAQHCHHSSNALSLLPVETPTAICQAGVVGTIGGNAFDSNRCAPFPISTLLEQKNPTCKIETYAGGLSCCRDGLSLLDADQENPWPDQYLEYRLKFRFYFEEYKRTDPDSKIAKVNPSHENVVRLYWATESFAGEYDITQCDENVPSSQCVQIITSRWTVRDFMRDCSLHDASVCTGKGSKHDETTEGIKLIYAGPHCHAPSCLSMELYNADTGRLLCHVEPIYGQSHEIYDEHGYLALPPCLWGDGKEGLAALELLTLNTTLLSIKRNNNTLPHTGEMASWQMRGIVVPKKTDEPAQVKKQHIKTSESSTKRPMLRNVWAAEEPTVP